MPKKLYRIEKDHVISGVCVGLAKYFDIDPIILRVLFVFLGLLQGFGILLYLVLVFVLPKEGQHETFEEKVGDLAEKAEKVSKKAKNSWAHSSRVFVGSILVIGGLIFLLNKFFSFPWFRWDIFWPITLIVVGFYVLFKRTQ